MESCDWLNRRNSKHRMLTPYWINVGLPKTTPSPILNQRPLFAGGGGGWRVVNSLLTSSSVKSINQLFNVIRRIGRRAVINWRAMLSSKRDLERNVCRSFEISQSSDSPLDLCILMHIFYIFEIINWADKAWAGDFEDIHH